MAAGALAGCEPAAKGDAAAAEGDAAEGALSATGASGTVGGAICPEDWLGEMPVVDAADIVETRDFDVVVLGAGRAGAQAALAAAEEGVSVAVVEMQPEDTYSCNGDDIATYNSKFVVSHGYGPYDLGEVAAEYVRRGNGRVNADVIKAFVENSGEMLDNMIDNYIPETSTMLDEIGVNFVIQHAYGKEDGSFYPMDVSGFKNWATSVQTAGTKNPTPVFEREGISRLTEFDLCALHGAQDQGAEIFWGTTPFLFLNSQGDRFMNEAMAQMIGETFLRATSPGNIGIITDSKFMQTIEQVGCDHGAPNWGNPDQIYAMQAAVEALQPGPEGGIIPGTDVVSLAGEEKKDFGGGGGGGHEPEANCFAANTLEGLLGYLGYEGDALANALASIERYNELCAAGVDSDYGKDAQYLIAIDTPPFYASFDDNKKTTRAGLVTLAGVPCDKNLNVLKADRSGTIKGLYATGNVLGERYGNGYATPSAGNSIGMARTHGRVAGKAVAAL